MFFRQRSVCARHRADKINIAFPFSRGKEKTVPGQRSTLYQGRISSAVPPWFAKMRAYGYENTPTSYVRHTSQNTRRDAFDCALRGPFDGCFLAQLSPTWALCTARAAVISASTVSIDRKSIAQARPLVKCFLQNSKGRQL